MEVRGAGRLSIWTGLLLISGAAAVTKYPNTYPMNSPAWIDIPECTFIPATDIAEWKTNSVRLQKKSPAESPQETLDQKCNCKILPNGTLYLQRLDREGDSEYKVEVHSDNGTLKCGKTVTLTVQYPVDAPFLNYTCKDKKRLQVICLISRGSASELHLTSGGAGQKSTNGKSLSATFKIDGATNVSCTAGNKVSQAVSSAVISCDPGDGWSWYLILAVAAGGVAFIIFIVLIIYSVRTCRRPGGDEESRYNNNQSQHIQQRQLPHPPVQAVAPPCVSPDNEGIPSNKPAPHRQRATEEATPRSKKERRTKQRPPDPQQTENLPLNHQTRPPLPGNHPNDQPPKPTPRTKSKPPQKNRH